MIKGQKIELKVNTYRNWVEAQNIPIIKEYYIKDLKTVPVADWAFAAQRRDPQPDRHRRTQRCLCLSKSRPAAASSRSG